MGMRSTSHNASFAVSPTRKMWRLLTPAQRRGAVAMLALMLVGMALETLGVGLVIPAIALLTRGNLATTYPTLQPVLDRLGNPSQETLVVGGMMALFIVYLLKTLFLAFLAWRQARFAYGVQTLMSQRLFGVYLRQPYTFHLQRNSAQLIRNVTTEVGIFAGVLTSAMSVVAESLVLFGVSALLLTVEPVGAVTVMAVLALAAWASHRLTRVRLTRWGLIRQRHEGLRIQHLQQGLGGAKEVKLLGREAEFLDQYREHSDQSARVAQMQTTLQQLPRLWLELLAVGGLAIVVVTLVAQGRPLEVILPTLALFAAAAFRMMPSANRLLNAVQALRYSLPVIHTLSEEMSLPAMDASSDRGVATPFLDSLALRGVTYIYPGAAGPAIKSVSLNVRRGESVGFIGASGAGKSTLVDVLLGLLTPTAGDVTVDGQSIHGDLRTWQNKIGYVPQSIFLTDDTLRRNVAFGLANEKIDEEAVRRAIRAAQLEEFVASLPDGLETMVGERGVRLSGGQRQRIGIARALYHDPDVLVLDEATSSLDTTTEKGVLEAVSALHGIKTTIVVAHRMSTIEHCDRLYRLDNGCLVEEVHAPARAAVGADVQ
jgi:ABC-type multidrug transport system fused ATPase/permease subunit